MTTFSMLLFSIGYAGTVLSWSEFFTLHLACFNSSLTCIVPQIGTSRDMAAQLLRLANLPEGVSHEHRGELSVSRVTPVTISGLSFRYPSRPDALVLRDISLTISKNSCTAIVGRSGSGKSTIASLLLSLYESPLSSRGLAAISLGGVDIRLLHTLSLRSLISVVSQQPTIFPGTIQENISYGLDETSPLRSMHNICAAAQAAGIDDFIYSLPQGYTTIIGDGGVGLSGGQAQRLVIARALVRRPQILILDEATSSLDPNSAEVIRQTVRRLVSAQTGLTVVIITHAREMMEIADQVVVLEQGCLVERGRYRDLVGRSGGRLRAMVRDCL